MKLGGKHCVKASQWGDAPLEDFKKESEKDAKAVLPKVKAILDDAYAAINKLLKTEYKDGKFYSIEDKPKVTINKRNNWVESEPFIVTFLRK